ncbi:DUF421 domain-containing protein [Pontibacter silvestris]|uniref:DUF421 domain-containing protein n=1 Tax=Pontibacter silvestris TaxID=2305183 RepID=A0ABW4X408_9BACT|nr:YetF domain-containing protein [Pontibacter silvestris]MCC9137956.1 DUF421 domain-containing protein [Pontibacter silvestris]
MQDFFEIAFGLEEQSLTWWQMSLRAIGVFVMALIILRIGSVRIFGKNTAFDIVLGVIYGSILSRAITGNSPFWPTIVAALVLVLLHNGLAALAYRTHFGVGDFIKGKPKVLIKDGDLQHEILKSNGITDNDLLEALRNSGNDDGLDMIKAAYLERSGDISIILKKKKGS